MATLVRHGLTALGVLISHPLAFFMVPIYGMLWYAFEPRTFDWHAVALLATWFMTLLI